MLGEISIKQIKFERELKLIICFIRRYGIDHIDYDIDVDIDDMGKWDGFIASVHNGFFLAQNKAIDMLTNIINDRKELVRQLAIARNNRDKPQCNVLSSSISRLKYQEAVVRKSMDAIAWQVFRYDITTIRRLYCGEEVIDITDSNITSALTFIEMFRKSSPEGFVLINDLTSFLQVGDVVTVDKNNGIVIEELKSGKVNEEVFDLITEAYDIKCPRYLYYSLKAKGKKFVEQFMRNLNQFKRAQDVLQTISTGEGIDLITGQKIRIVQEVIELSTFSDKIAEMLEECPKKGYSFSVIDGCLLVGVYDATKYPSTAFELWAKASGVTTPIYDARQSFFDPTGYPLFLQGFSDTTIIDIVSGRKTIKMAIDTEVWLKKLEEIGLTYRIMSKKETARENTKTKNSRQLYEFGGHGIEIQKGNIKFILGNGIFSRMFTAYNTPASLIKYIISSLEHSEKLKQQSDHNTV